jgi:outer membrane scaffolding protein for murein synthesis (MipA/OmpV family)
MRTFPFNCLALASMAASLAATPALAQNANKQPLWELGAAGIGASQQAYPGASAQVSRGLALPYFVYRGEVLRADRDTAGLRAIKTERMELDIGVAGSFGARADEVDERLGMPRLGTLIEFGPRVKWKLSEDQAGGGWRAELPLRGVFDLSDGAAHRGMAFEPKLVYQRRASAGWFYSTSVGAIVADKRLAQSFYGVAPQYALASRPSYEAQSGLVALRLNASVFHQLSRDWRVFGFGRIDSVAGAANENSPLVKKTNGASLGLGLTYTWLRSERSAVD